MAAPVLQFKRGNAGVAGTVPALRPGEPAISLNNFDFFIGIDTSVSNNKFFGSHRYWGREDGTESLKLKLVDKDGSNYVAIKTPDSLAGIVTYILPGVQGAESSVLTNDGSGNLTWSSGSLNAVFSGITTIGGEFFDVNVDSDFAGITTFSNTTDNTLGDPDTGAVQIDGGLGVDKNVTVGSGLSVAGESHFVGVSTFYDSVVFTNSTDNNLGNYNTGAVQIDGGLGVEKNLTVGQNLSVLGYSEFVGVVTFKGGTINLGDQNTDDINVAGEFISNLTPNTDDTYDIGDNTTPKRWRHASFSGVGTFATGAVVDSIQIGITGATEIDTSSGTLTLDSADGTVIVDDDLSVTGVSTFTGFIDANDGLDVTGHSELDDVNVSGIATIANLDVQTDFDIYAPTATFHDNVIIEGNLTVNGTETIINTATLTVQDKEIILGLGTNGSPSDASASGGGVSIASTEGNPLVDFIIAGIHTHPNTYKDIIWVRADDLGVGTTDAWHFNYAVGIGSTQVADGVRLAVTNTQITDSTLSTPQINVSGASTVGGLLDVNGGLDVTGQVVLNNDLSVTGVSTFTGAIDANGGLDVSGGETVLSSATVSDLTQGRVVLAGASGSLEDDPDLTFGSDGLIIGAGGINVTGVSTFSTDLVVGGDVRINGNDIQASDGNANITLTSNTLTTFAGDIRVNGNDIQASDGTTAITMSSANVTVAGDLTVGGNDIKASDGTTAITLADTTGAVTTANDLTVSGNLYVSGNTTQVNTAALTVEDRTIDLGIVNGATPASATTWDLGVLFNYHAGGSAKKSAVIWEHGDTRFKFASVLSADTNGSDNDTPQLSVTTFAPIEVAELWVNNTCTGGSQQVVGCVNSELQLQNITVDAGTF